MTKTHDSILDVMHAARAAGVPQALTLEKILRAIQILEQNNVPLDVSADYIVRPPRSMPACEWPWNAWKYVGTDV